ncbi:sodium/glutamate symporter [Shouchella shacheensis]|uniref:sodium/glutamate symporter n=1 Tax=Shouchella shacheensis TaxID=1649580 RepID=UPI000B30AFFF|nr:sodium:glutamate symporter [Shouchella shacheensis]
MVSIIDLTIDLGLVSILLLMGVLLRAKFKIVQRFFIPASMIAGFAGLFLGPNGLAVLPFSEAISSYPTILIAVIFGAIPIGAAQVDWKKTFSRVRNMWLYSMLLTVLMWGGGVMIAFWLLGIVWELNPGFGLVMGAGFLGGHGTVAALAESMAHYGWAEYVDLGYTSATVGLLTAIIGGLIIIKKSARKNQTSFISDFEDLPPSMRSGLIQKEEREANGEVTVSTSTIDPLIFHLAVIGVVVLVSYFIQSTMQGWFPQISVPLLSLAFIIGLLLQKVLKLMKANDYIDRRTIDNISGTATDLTVVFGIASINMAVVASYIVPLIALFVFGILWAYAIFHFIAPRVFHDNWFENGVFGWGWSTGTVAMGIALLRIVDPKSKSTTLDDYSLGYMGMVPVEVVIITFSPMLIMTGFGSVYITVLLGAGALLLFIAAKSGWLVKGKEVKARRQAS